MYSLKTSMQDGETSVSLFAFPDALRGELPHILGHTTQSFCRVLLWHTFGILGNEQDHVRTNPNVVQQYFEKVQHYLNSHTDTSMLPEGCLEVWDACSTEEQDAIRAILTQMSDAFTGFPVEKMQVIDSLVDCEIDVHGYDMPFFLPVVVGTGNGATGIFPVFFPEDAKVLEHILGDMIRNEDVDFIANFHLWDIAEGRILKLQKKQHAEVAEAIDNMFQILIF